MVRRVLCLLMLAIFLVVISCAENTKGVKNGKAASVKPALKSVKKLETKAKDTPVKKTEAKGKELAVKKTEAKGKESTVKKTEVKGKETHRFAQTAPAELGKSGKSKSREQENKRKFGRGRFHETDKEEHGRKQPCHSRNFKISNCCSNMPGPLFPPRVLKSCNRGRNDHASLLSSNYIFNKFQHPATNEMNFCNKEDDIGQMACMATCFFTHRNMINGDEVDYNVASSYFRKMVHPSWYNTVGDAIHTCKIVAESEFVQSVKDPQSNKKCSTKPMTLLQCMRKYFVMNCPEYDSTAECDRNVRALNRCNAFKMDIMDVTPTEKNYETSTWYPYTTTSGEPPYAERFDTTTPPPYWDMTTTLTYTTTADPLYTTVDTATWTYGTTLVPTISYGTTYTWTYGTTTTTVPTTTYGTTTWKYQTTWTYGTTTTLPSTTYGTNKYTYGTNTPYGTTTTLATTTAYGTNTYTYGTTIWTYGTTTTVSPTTSIWAYAG